MNALRKLEPPTCSHAVGRQEIVLLDDTIGASFDKAVAKWGDRVALGVPTQGLRWTYAELSVRVNAFANALAELGMLPGERLGIWSPNRAEWLVTQYAAAKLGLILVCINPAYRSVELEYAINKTGCKALVTTDRLKDSNYIAILQQLAPELAKAAPEGLKSVRLPSLRILIHLGHEVVPGFYRFADLISMGEALDESRLRAISKNLKPNDRNAILFTSGTTGIPKGAIFSHYQLLNNGHLVGLNMRITAQDVVAVPLPLYHIFGMLTGNLLSMLQGAEVVYTGELFDPALVLEAVQAERCTSIYGVPTTFKAIIDHPGLERFDLSSLRTGLIAGSAVPIDLCRQIVTRMHVPELLQVYGMTESSATISIPSLDDPVDVRIGSAGHVLPHLEIKLIDAAGAITPVGVPGELCMRGFTVTLGYWDDEAKTAEAIDADGWLHTGDLATMDEQRIFRIVGRLKELVIRGGENIHPSETEMYLLTHSKIDAVQIVGVPDAKFGEELCACVKLKAGEHATEEEIRNFCRGKIAHYKIPRYVRFIEEFPMTLTGKVQRNMLRTQSAASLGLDLN